MWFLNGTLSSIELNLSLFENFDSDKELTVLIQKKDCQSLGFEVEYEICDCKIFIVIELPCLDNLGVWIFEFKQENQTVLTTEIEIK